MALSSIVVPTGCVMRDEVLAPGDDPHVAGRRLATAVLAELGATLSYEGTRPVAAGARVSISHTKSRVVAIAGGVARLGIDLVDHTDHARIARIAPRFLTAEPGDDDLAIAARFAATEAALKALGLGLLDGGVIDHASPIRVSLAPPRIAIDDGELALVLGRLGDTIVAIAYA